MLYAKDFRDMARKCLGGCWVTAILCMVVYGILAGALNATVVGVILLGGPLAYGYTAFWMEQVRWRRPGIEVLFTGLQKCFVSSIVVYLLQGIFTFLWGLLFVIPGVIKGYSYAMSMYILRDHPEMEALEVIDTSRAMMDGNKWRLFCLDLSFIGWYLLSLVTFGLAGLYVGPYVQCARAQFYEAVKAEYEAEHPMNM